MAQEERTQMSTTAPDGSIVAALAQKLGIEIDKVEYDEQGSLIKLTLSELSLSQLPPEIGLLRNLQELDLSNNQLSRVASRDWTVGELEEAYSQS